MLGIARLPNYAILPTRNRPSLEHTNEWQSEEAMESPCVLPPSECPFCVYLGGDRVHPKTIRNMRLSKCFFVFRRLEENTGWRTNAWETGGLQMESKYGLGRPNAFLGLLYCQLAVCLTSMLLPVEASLRGWDVALQRLDVCAVGHCAYAGGE